jgi:protein transport protein SEC24
MSDYTMYHSLGQGGQPTGPGQPYQQHESMGYGQPPPPGQQQYHDGHQQPPMGGQIPPTSQGYGPPQGQEFFPNQAPQPQDELAAQMGGMSLGGEAHHTARRKKKDRHAYHTVEAAGSSQAFNGMPPAGTPATNFLNANSPGPVGPGSQFGSPQLTPGISQFPAPVNPTFTPGSVASPVDFAARGGQIDPNAPPAFHRAPTDGQLTPDDLPSVPASRDTAQRFYLNNVYPTFERHVPPPATVSFVAFDQGNSSPKFARLTMNNIPATLEALHTTGLPLGLMLQPLAPLQAGELSIPVLDFGETGPPRCRRCRAYINPFMMFRSGGNKFVCNLCTHPNDTPSEYFCATSPQGVRVDRDQRPELTRGTVEFVVPKEYWTKEPVGLRWLFLIDVTQESFNKGFLEAFCEGILSALYGGEDQEAKDEGEESARSIPKGAKVGFVTFDKDIHFYNVNASLEQAQMMIMPDIEDPFVPLSDGLFVDPYESKAVIMSLLTRLPTMFSNIKNPEPALLPALSSAVAALEKTGGKVVCSLSALPTWGPGRLFLRDDGKHPGGEIDKKLFTTEHPAWRKMAEKMTAAGIGTDFFLAAPSGGYLDIATIGALAQISSLWLHTNVVRRVRVVYHRR